MCLDSNRLIKVGVFFCHHSADARGLAKIRRNSQSTWEESGLGDEYKTRLIAFDFSMFKVLINKPLWDCLHAKVIANICKISNTPILI